MALEDSAADAARRTPSIAIATAAEDAEYAFAVDALMVEEDEILAKWV
jgi:hypothetical protein